MSTKTNKVDQLNCREYLVGGKLKKWDGDENIKDEIINLLNKY